ncbi:MULTISPECIES: hypothetical protein [unclassified Gilliamella]|uniref:hypothetical protein n=1 Tax=unclassified Gilliamella TaxID=2685620 RepID=UPI00130A5C16|nr:MULTISPECIES: hypothetical protein [unclassified Gilliamella]MWP48557.1 hypothetical protein [Gilliamella sp. Lep-s35]MWP68619.1 hypothetical protein [Gilliamella sp. Lep-s5]MWP76713.1 hypothetical protein [Gilliamella sp. Lep-s21]
MNKFNEIKLEEKVEKLQKLQRELYAEYKELIDDNVFMKMNTRLEILQTMQQILKMGGNNIKFTK